MIPAVSIIVPMYNVEPYLERCINSLLKQTMKNIEIILVNDGSPDNSGLIAEEFARKDNRIKVVHRKNGGLGYARNSGLEIAKGEYVGFVDSDDWVNIDMFNIMYNEAKSKNADLVECGYVVENLHLNTNSPQKPKLEYRTYEKNEIHDVIIPNFVGPDRLKGISVWRHIFKRSIIEKALLRFESERDVYAEDYIFCLDYLPHVNRLSVIDKPLYHYVVNFKSLSRSFRPALFEMTLFKDSIVREKVTEMELLDKCTQNIDRDLFGIIPRLIMNYASKNNSTSHNEKISCIKDILENPRIRSVVTRVKNGRISMFNRLMYSLIRSNKAMLLYITCKVHESLIQLYYQIMMKRFTKSK